MLEMLKGHARMAKMQLSPGAVSVGTLYFPLAANRVCIHAEFDRPMAKNTRNMNGNERHDENPNEALFQRLARRYMWRWSIEKTLSRRRQLVAQVMDIGTFDDATALIEAIGELALLETLTNAEPGWFSPRSWAYWHYRLGSTPTTSEPPPAPRRFP